MIHLDQIARILSNHKPLLLADEARRAAAVVLILREGDAGPEILFIERAAHANDPWSGDVGFPGGKVEETDGNPQAAAVRETREEVGLDLRRAGFLGRLSDTLGAHMPVLVACFVYRVDAEASLQLNDEVRDLFWVPLAALAAPERQLTAPVNFQGETLKRPAIRLPIAGKPVLWGITYRLVTEFFRALKLESAPESDGDDTGGFP